MCVRVCVCMRAAHLYHESVLLVDLTDAGHEVLVLHLIEQLVT